MKGWQYLDGAWHFEYAGERYFTACGSDTPTRDGSRYIAVLHSDAPGDWVEVASGFGYLSEVRALVAQATAEGWGALDERP